MIEPAGTFDLQVNGYAGVDFNADDQATDDWRRAAAAMRADGVSAFLPTIITDSIDAMTRRLIRLVTVIQTEPLVRSMVAGIHVEGPFLNPGDGTAGAHPRRHLRPADVDSMKRLLDAGGGLVRLVTMAPECDAGGRVIRMLADAGIVVSAGHTDASRDQLAAAIDAGVSMFTHLGNGCSLQVPRHDNIIQRALSLSAKLWCCFIADGVHIAPFALGNYLKVTGIDRAIIVTDAMAAAGLGPGRYTLGCVVVDVDNSGRAMPVGGDGRLAGSVATMPRMIALLKQEFGLSEQEIDQLTRLNPAAALRRSVDHPISPTN